MGVSVLFMYECMIVIFLNNNRIENMTHKWYNKDAEIS
jgi:hypothetical protein